MTAPHRTHPGGGTVLAGTAPLSFASASPVFRSSGSAPPNLQRRSCMDVNNPVKNLSPRSGSASNEPDLIQQCQGIVRHAAEPWSPGEGIEAGIRRSARRTGLSYRRTRTFWYAQPCRLLWAEVTRLHAWHDAWLARRLARLNAELDRLEAEQARLEADRP